MFNMDITTIIFMGFTVLLFAFCIIIIICGILECYILRIRRRSAYILPLQTVDTEIVNPQFIVIR
jgi:hypothetical protein